MTAVLHIVSDTTRHRLPLLEALVDSVRGGADVVQIRDKKAPAGETYNFCEQLKSKLATVSSGIMCLVNDRVDVAMAAQMQGVHLAAKSLPLETVVALRDSIQWPGLIGCSVHAYDEAVAAAAAGADYITFGHIFDSESHKGLAPRGTRELARIVDAVSIPVIAIGGIDATNVDVVLETGCSGIAVIGAILQDREPAKAAERLKTRLVRSQSAPKVPFPQRAYGGLSHV